MRAARGDAAGPGAGRRRSRGVPAVLLALGLILLADGPAWAHKVHVFATAQGPVIEGSAYFTGGGAAADAPVRVFGPDGALRAQVQTDAEGRFRYRATRREDLRFVLRTADGHQADFTLFADELPADLPAETGATGAGSLGTWSGLAQTGGGAPAEPAAAEAAGPGAEGATGLSEARLRAVLAEELAPLRMAIDRYETRVRIADALAGVGFIFGLFGTAMFLAARRRRP